MRLEENQQLVLPKNIRQVGSFGDTYKIYVEDFVYTYVHQFMHRRKKENLVLAAVLLGKTVSLDDQEFVFICGAQKVDFQFDENEDSSLNEEAGELKENPSNIVISRQQEFWDRVYQRIKQYFDDQEIVGWYFNLDGSNLEINSQLQKFFESTYKKGSRFLYYEDSLEKEDAFFVQEQHRLQRLPGYAVFYQKNPQMQEFMIAERERLAPRPLRENADIEKRDDEVIQNYRAIMNKLNEKPTKRKIQPIVYVAGVAVLAVVAATGVTQIGNYQNLKVLEQTMQTLSGAVGLDDSAGDEEKTELKAEDSDAADENIVETAEGVDAGVSGETEAAQEGGELTKEDNGDIESEASENENDSKNEAIPPETSSQTENTAQQTTDSVAQASTTPSDYYIVKKGDSLVSISKAVYNTSSKVEEICALNNIENMDVIYEGQKLLLP